jgi:hypothetical protein
MSGDNAGAPTYDRLPKGDTAVICPTERTIDIKGTPTEYVGSTVVVLDKNFQVSWAWDAFDHLDVNRGPILGEVLQPGGAEQMNASTPVFPAVDWLHINAVSWSPEDGNLVVSIRHQDWVAKIDYRNGAGDGHVIWRLGQGGDFTVNSTDPDPWFSHPHDAHYIDDHTLILFDNGNTRRASDPTAHSRGQVWTLDEQTMTATLVVNADLGSYSGALGAAGRLSNGDYSFTLGTNGPVPPARPPAHTVEVRPDGTKVYDLAANTPEHRTFRVRTLYEGANDALAGAAGVNGAAAPGVLAAAASPTSNVPASTRFSDPAPLLVGGPGDGTVLSGGTFDVAPTFRGLDVAAARFIPQESFRPLAVAPVFALNYGAGSDSLPALYGLKTAAPRVPGNPVSPVFFGLADGPFVDELSAWEL